MRHLLHELRVLRTDGFPLLTFRYPPFVAMNADDCLRSSLQTGKIRSVYRKESEGCRNVWKQLRITGRWTKRRASTSRNGAGVFLGPCTEAPGQDQVTSGRASDDVHFDSRRAAHHKEQAPCFSWLVACFLFSSICRRR